MQTQHSRSFSGPDIHRAPPRYPPSAAKAARTPRLHFSSGELTMLGQARYESSNKRGGLNARLSYFTQESLSNPRQAW